jgi:hypothetical protein
MRTVFLAVMSTTTLMAMAAIAAQSKWRPRSRHAVAVARVEEPRAVRQIRSSNARIEDAVRRAAIYERSIALYADDPAASVRSGDDDKAPKRGARWT